MESQATLLSGSVSYLANDSLNVVLNKSETSDWKIAMPIPIASSIAKIVSRATPNYNDLIIQIMD